MMQTRCNVLGKRTNCGKMLFLQRADLPAHQFAAHAPCRRYSQSTGLVRILRIASPYPLRNALAAINHAWTAPALRLQCCMTAVEIPTTALLLEEIKDWSLNSVVENRWWQSTRRPRSLFISEYIAKCTIGLYYSCM